MEYLHGLFQPYGPFYLWLLSYLYSSLMSDAALPPPRVPGGCGALPSRWQRDPAGTAAASLLLLSQMLENPSWRQRLARAPAARVGIATSRHSLLMASTASFSVAV